MVPAAADDEPPRLRQRRAQRRWVRRLLIFVSCVMLLDSVVGERGLVRRIRAQHDLVQAAVRLDQLKRDNAALRDRIERLQSDPGTIEAAAREHLGLIRRGEILVIVKDRP
jgi:cell division protein FtsB